MLELEEPVEEQSFYEKLNCPKINQEVEVNCPKINQEVEVQQGVEQLETSIHALNGSLGYRTLRVTRYHAR